MKRILPPLFFSSAFGRRAIKMLLPSFPVVDRREDRTSAIEGDGGFFSPLSFFF